MQQNFNIKGEYFMWAKIKAWLVKVKAWLLAHWSQFSALLMKVWSFIHKIADVVMAFFKGIENDLQKGAATTVIKIGFAVAIIVMMLRGLASVLAFLHDVIDFTGAMLVTLKMQGWEVMVIIIVPVICYTAIQIVRALKK
jgi:phage-related minor tail protein